MLAAREPPLESERSPSSQSLSVAPRRPLASSSPCEMPAEIRAPRWPWPLQRLPGASGTCHFSPGRTFPLRPLVLSPVPLSETQLKRHLLRETFPDASLLPSLRLLPLPEPFPGSAQCQASACVQTHLCLPSPGQEAWCTAGTNEMSGNRRHMPPAPSWQHMAASQSPAQPRRGDEAGETVTRSRCEHR